MDLACPTGMRMVGLMVVVAFSVPAVATAGNGRVVEDNISVVKTPDAKALEVVRLGVKNVVQVGQLDGAWVQVRVQVQRGTDTVSIQGWMQGRFVRLEDGSLASTEVIQDAFGNEEPAWGAGGDVGEDAGWTELAESETVEWPVPEVDESNANDNWLSFDTGASSDSDENSFTDESTESFFETEEPDPIEDDLSEPGWFE